MADYHGEENPYYVRWVENDILRANHDRIYIGEDALFLLLGPGLADKEMYMAKTRSCGRTWPLALASMNPKNI